MSQSIPYRLSQAVVAALRAAFEPQGAVVHDNPSAPAELREGERVLFVEDGRDQPGDQPGQSERRAFRLGVGVINRSASDRQAADADMQAAKQAVTEALVRCGRDLRAQQALVGFTAPREGERTYRVDGIDVGGALILTQFDFSYVTPAAVSSR